MPCLSSAISPQHIYSNTTNIHEAYDHSLHSIDTVWISKVCFFLLWPFIFYCYSSRYTCVGYIKGSHGYYNNTFTIQKGCMRRIVKIRINEIFYMFFFFKGIKRENRLGVSVQLLLISLLFFFFFAPLLATSIP